MSIYSAVMRIPQRVSLGYLTQVTTANPFRYGSRSEKIVDLHGFVCSTLRVPDSGNGLVIEIQSILI